MKQVYKMGKTLSLISIIVIILLSIVNPSEYIFISQKTAEIGTILLYLMIMSKSVYFICRKLSVSKDNVFLKFLQQNNKYQRDQGLIVFNILFVHGYIETIKYVFDFNILVYNYLTVLIPTIILIYMECTSFSFFQNKYKGWKKSHTVIWMTLPLILLHIIILSDSFFKYAVFTIVIFLISILEVMVGIKKGTKHVAYIILGFFFTIAQFKIVKLYEVDILLAKATEESKAKENTDVVNLDELILAQETADEQETIEQDTVVMDTTNVYQDGTFTGEGFGHKGSIVVETTIENDDIVSVEVVSQNEDEPWWEPVVNSIPAQIVENDSTEGIGYIAGSTHSSEGLIEAVNNSLENAKI